MVSGKKTKLLGSNRFISIVIVAIVLVVAVHGCVYDPVYYGPPSYSEYHPHYYDYYYYPSAGVYFQFTTGYYYYRGHDRWVRVRKLPPNVYIDPRDRVQIRIDSEKPYLRHDEHARRFKPDGKIKRYEVDKERSRKEREANREWYQKYEQWPEKKEKNERDDGRKWNEKKISR